MINRAMKKNEEENIDFLGLRPRQIKIALELRKIAQDFFQKESSGISLMTVTKTSISRDLKTCTIYLTIFPDSKESQALAFAKRQRANLRTVIKEKLKIRTIPRVEIKLDLGEKARMRTGSQKI